MRGKVSPERFTEGGRATEPDARRAPFRRRFANALATQSSITGVDKNVQAYISRVRIRCKLSQRLLVDISRGVKEVNRRRNGASGSPRLHGQFLHAGDERRDANASADPDLVRAIVVESEATVGPFHLYFLPDAELLPQPAGVVAQFLGDEGDPGVFSPPSGRDRVGMGALEVSDVARQIGPVCVPASRAAPRFRSRLL